MIQEYRAKIQRDPVPAWILPPLSCQFLQEIAALLPPVSSAFEFGSGCSTHALRRAFASIASIEDSAEYLAQSEKIEDGVEKRAADYSDVIPLRRCWNRFRPIESFDLSKTGSLARLQEARLILVDSPPNPAKREHALYLALQEAPVGAVIVLDDLEVSATSRFAYRLARQNSGAFRFWMLPIDHQLGVFLKLQAGRIRSRPTLRELVGTWLRA